MNRCLRLKSGWQEHRFVLCPILGFTDHERTLAPNTIRGLKEFRKRKWNGGLIQDGGKTLRRISALNGLTEFFLRPELGPAAKPAISRLLHLEAFARIETFAVL